MDGAVVAALACVALAARLVPLTWSPLPHSVDGFSLMRISSDIAAQGGWALDPADVNSYNLKLPGFSILFAALMEVAGLSPLVHVQLLLPMVTCLTVLPGYLIGVKATGRRLGGFAAGLFLSLFGSFLAFTSGTAKESIALLVFPVAALLFHEREDPRRRALAFVLLIFLPLLHALTAFLTLGTVAALVVLGHRRAIHRGRFSARALALDIATGPGLAIPAWAYYAAVDLPFLSEVLAPASLALFLGIVVLLTAGLATMSRPVPRRLGRRLANPLTRVLLVPAIGFLVILENVGNGLFVGAVGTQGGLIQILPAILAIAALVVVGVSLLRRTTNRASDLIVSMLTAPIALILFGLLRGLDAFGLTLVYRAFDFMDYALAALVAVAFAAMWKGLGRVRPLRGALVAGLIGVLLATTPMAWDTPAVFGVQNVTTTEEFEALAFLASIGAHNVTTDERLASVGAWWFGYSTDALLPAKIRDNETIPPGYALVLERWSTVGAQIHPAPNLIVSPGAVRGFLAANRVLYVAGPPGDRIFVVQVLG